VDKSTRAWAFPYCRRCAEHVRTAERASILAVTVICLGLAAALFVGFTKEAYIGWMVFGAGFVGAMLVHQRTMNDAKQMRLPSCASAERTVSYVGWQGTFHAFDVDSKRYALALMLANKKKLINVPPLKLGDCSRRLRTAIPTSVRCQGAMRLETRPQ